MAGITPGTVFASDGSLILEFDARPNKVRPQLVLTPPSSSGEFGRTPKNFHSFSPHVIIRL